MLQPTAVRRAAALVATAGPARRKPAGPPRAVAQLYAAAASLPFVLSSGAIAATGANLLLLSVQAVEAHHAGAAADACADAIINITIGLPAARHGMA